MNFEKPILVLSACLDLQPVRYNGQLVKDEFVLKLRDFCQVITVCPEVSIGLGVPREKIIVYVEDGIYKVSQPATGRDLTNELNDFAEKFIENLKEVDGFLLKSKSPSCGVSNTLVYKDSQGLFFHSKGKGLFAMKVLKTFPLVPVEDEGRLKNPSIKDHFLTRLFSLAHWRVFSKQVNSIKDLYEFHRRYKYLLMVHSQQMLRKMGKLLANYSKEQDLQKIVNEYGEMFKLALCKKPTVGSHINVMMHIFGHFSDFINQSEKRHFLNVLQKLREGKIPITVPREILRSWAYRFDDKYVLSQVYLNPYPQELE
ncbi:YbgA family protein [Pseudothermotoga thermarum]|uniref:DUF1722 domain-containing protein n=1 Tax=Pseudothermotoga thermarum DSM 5069 TaxID=688269 RepID=F7YTY8_9THEM|nr:DUF523 and DUF1722 domain-containing protein [Pseudothermotoga thermarum]AEH51570.1 protein of unknown function DUF1722 [Pseudothermotoga thermarum DSM 5069]